MLIYHKNRLITRYRWQLGEFVKSNRNKLKNCGVMPAMFGFIEVKDYFRANMFKTVLKWLFRIFRGKICYVLVIIDWSLLRSMLNCKELMGNKVKRRKGKKKKKNNSKIYNQDSSKKKDKSGNKVVKRSC